MCKHLVNAMLHSNSASNENCKSIEQHDTDWFNSTSVTQSTSIIIYYIKILYQLQENNGLAQVAFSFNCAQLQHCEALAMEVINASTLKLNTSRPFVYADAFAAASFVFVILVPGPYTLSCVARIFSRGRNSSHQLSIGIRCLHSKLATYTECLLHS